MPPIPHKSYLPTAAEPVRVLEGDCLTWLPKIPDNSIDAVITDPPYGIDYQSAWRIDKSKWKPKIANDKNPFVWWMYDSARIVRDGGAVLCFCRWDVAEAFRLAIGWAGLMIRAQIVWDRMCHGAGDTAGSPAPQHDIVWYATKGRRTFAGLRPKSIVRAMRLSGAVLTHPNEKPIGLMVDLVGSYTARGELILDPFAGSGTTGVAALNTGRRCLMIEKEPKYAEIARKRIADQIQASTPTNH